MELREAKNSTVKKSSLHQYDYKIKLMGAYADKLRLASPLTSEEFTDFIISLKESKRDGSLAKSTIAGYIAAWSFWADRDGNGATLSRGERKRLKGLTVGSRLPRGALDVGKLKELQQ